MNIIKDHQTPGRLNRPNTNPRSSLYRRVIEPEWIVYHNPHAPNWNAKRLHDFGKTKHVRPDLRSWNYSVDKDEVWEMVPVGEATFQAGDNLGPGNTNSISMEVCDRGHYSGDSTLFWADQENAARLCAFLIKTVPSLRKFPECMTQHNRWSGKNCPRWIRETPGGWNRLLGMVDNFLKETEIVVPDLEVPELIRPIPVRAFGKETNLVAYLGRYSDGRIRTFSEIAPTVSLSSSRKLRARGEGDHVNIRNA